MQDQRHDEMRRWAEDQRRRWEQGHPFRGLEHRSSHRARHPSGRYLFVRFAGIFGLFVVLACVILAIIGAGALLLYPGFPSYEPRSLRLFFLLGGAVFVLVLAMRRVGSLATRRFTSPLSDTMKAADALAEGDLSARVPVEGSPEFRSLARSFNRMAEALETADRQRRELLADIAHELRTPLTIVQGNLEGLRDGVYTPTQEHLELVLDETQKLSRLVEDLRLLTLAEAGQLPLDLQPVDVSLLLADVRDAFGVPADEAGIALKLEAAGSLPTLFADPQRLGQILGNLVTNALRHTPPGGEVVLGAGLCSEEAEAPGVEIWVADTGRGIPPEDLPHVFERFWRGDAARSHQAGAGSGLGLTIARSLVELHGGRIWAESAGLPGEGTTVKLVLPHAPVAGEI
jgi:two-component system OmpR family sensor kinase/two-component system sensor histidine kinase BaeS